MPNLLLVGYGYTASRVGRRLLERGWGVRGTRRSGQGLREIEEEGVTPLEFDGKGPADELRDAIRTATHLLVSAPPGQEGDPVLLHHRDDVAGSSSLGWLGYLSTTGVYGDHGGDVVTESTPPTPGTERAKWRRQAEEGWEGLAAGMGATLQIFRLSGIYGPGRSALDRLSKGTARRVVSPDLVFNRIHVDDIVGAVLAGIDRAGTSGVFNVSDDLPAPPGEVVEYAARLLGIDPPPEIPLDDASLSAAARSFYEENKRVDNARLKGVLGYRLRYPTYREGLEQIAAGRHDATDGPSRSSTGAVGPSR